MAENESLEEQFTQARNIITQAREALERGDDVDLTGLDVRVAHLCSAVAQLGNEQAKHFANLLQGMMGELNIVAELLRKRHEEVVRQIEGLNQQKQAAMAYKAAQKTSDNSDPEDQ